MAEDEKTKRNAERVLCAMYRLARGRTDITVAKEDLYAEVGRERLLDLNDEAFDRYRQMVGEEVRAIRLVEGRPDRPDLQQASHTGEKK